LSVAEPLLRVDVIATEDHSARVVLAGELDMSSYQSLQARIRELVDEGRWQIAFDLSDLSFMDSTGLNTFVEIHKLLQPAGGRLTIERPRPPVAKLFAISGLERILGVSGAPPAGGQRRNS
jgi:anti-sigma B factor antagonist